MRNSIGRVILITGTTANAQRNNRRISVISMAE